MYGLGGGYFFCGILGQRWTLLTFWEVARVMFWVFEVSQVAPTYCHSTTQPNRLNWCILMCRIQKTKSWASRTQYDGAMKAFVPIVWVLVFSGFVISTLCAAVLAVFCASHDHIVELEGTACIFEIVTPSCIISPPWHFFLVTKQYAGEIKGTR